MVSESNSKSSQSLIFLLLFNFFAVKSCESLNIQAGVKWPNGVVPYKLHNSLTLKDMSEFKKAIDEYHSKTCIKFQPWKEGDVDFVSIEIDNNVTCGSSSTQSCKIGGYQYARFNGNENCRKSQIILQSLGLTLCLGYEQKRNDRDDYVTFKESCDWIPVKNESNRQLGIYDYASKWHQSCNTCKGGWPTTPNVTTCGIQRPGALSRTDVDGLNELYNCSGCKRHRWRPIENLTHEDRSNMYNFNYGTLDSPIYPCRAGILGSLLVGKYDDLTKHCYISYFGGKLHIIKGSFEVLTIPGGTNEECSNYKVVYVNPTEPVLTTTMVPGGASVKYNTWKSYIAYANYLNSTNGYTIGNAWLEKGHGWKFNAEVVVGVDTEAVAIKARHFSVLTCDIDTTCILKKLLDERRSYK
ncbi:unnamed protein product [Orchesella dallaii]|uniref:Metalloendopeptidase n=1 Tax=Orchesella dallaii TaxID=48710 RepID=A0ABP1QP40_9HEXA